MQSYLDVSMMIVFGTAAVLLLFILISFVISNRRCSTLEKENQKLKQSLEKAVLELQEQVKKQGVSVDTLERKSRTFDSSISYATQTLQDLIDKQRSMDTSVDNLNIKVEQQKKEFQDKSVENQPIYLAKTLLAQGMSIDEVCQRTGLPSYEVTMLAKVNNYKVKPLTIEEQARAQTEKFFSKGSNSESVQGKDSSHESVEPNPLPPHHVANLKARDAYGISAKAGLRRPRYR